MSGMRRAAAWVAAACLVGVLPIASPALVPTDAAGASRTFGSTPLDDVLYWADVHRKCGLTRDQLAALMMAVTWPESGAPASQSPSPMTLSRYDNQLGLHSFGSPGIYTHAFWHPGIGMYAFDSAGGWGMTAAARISSWSSSAQAAATMSARWCQNPSRSYVWGPWHACSKGTCEQIYQAIYQGGKLTNVARDHATTRDGGMATRTCVLDDVITVTCWFVDPSKAQGYKGFTIPHFGPSPISAPFYVYERGGHEWRVWMKEDTGFHTDVRAWKPLGANARHATSWGFSRNLCDHWHAKGPCGTFLDVAPNHPFAHEIEWMAARGITTGFSDGTYRPLHHVTRQAMAAFLHRLSGSPAFPTGTLGFIDVDSGSPFLGEILWLASTGITEGFPDGTFRPLDSMTRQAMAAFLHRLAGSPAGPFPHAGFSDVPPGHPFAHEIAWMAARGITTGFADNTFRPGQTVTRQAMAAFLERYAGCCTS